MLSSSEQKLINIMKNRRCKIPLETLISIIKTTAKEELLPRVAKVAKQKKADNSLLTEADIAIQKSIETQLKQLDDTILFLAEEMSVAEQNAILAQKEKAIWILDPLDGTTNFSVGIPYYAVSLALIENGETVLGIVYDPERDECFVAEKGQGAFLNKQALNLDSAVADLGDAVACIDLKRLPENMSMKLVKQQPFRSQRSFGGVALDWCWLAAARFDLYLHGKQNIWDYAAGLLIYTEAGGASCSLDGKPVYLPELSARAGIGASNSALFKKWTDWLNITTSL